MSTQECAAIGCTRPVKGICQMCKAGFCEMHAKTEQFQTRDGKLQYALLCNSCFQKALQGEYNPSKDSKRTILQFVIIDVFIVLIAVAIYALFYK